MILLDSNLLIRMARSQDPQSSMARAAVQSLLGITRLITFNATDFRDLGVDIIDPAQV